MKKFYFFMMFLSMIPGKAVYSQVSVTADGSKPDSSAMLDVKSTSLGFLIPRMTLAQRQAITKPATALLVYQTDGETGFYYNAGTKTDTSWKFLYALSGSISDSCWSTSGNSGTSPGTDFIGTTDNQDFVIKVNSGEILRFAKEGNRIMPGTNNSADLGTKLKSFQDIYLDGKLFLDDSIFLVNDGSGGTFTGLTANSTNTGYNNTFVGYHAGKANTSGYDNLFSGTEAGFQNTTGFCNTASGFQALYSNTSGWNNSAHGYGSLYSNSTGMDNSGYGVGAIYLNTTGNKNSALGYSALYSNTTGDSNVAIGYFANVNANNLSNVVVIGSGAIATSSDEVRLGNLNAKSLYCMGAYTPVTNEAPNMYVANTGQIMRSIQPGGGIGGAGVPTEVAFWSAPASVSSDPNFYWDNVNKRLGLGTLQPTEQLDLTQNMNLPISTPAAGNIFKNGILFLHNYSGTQTTNTFLGLNAGNLNLLSGGNTGTGYEALQSLTTGYSNTAMGAFALTSNNSGSDNTALGNYALFSNTKGNPNIAVGKNSLFSNMSGCYNIAIGHSALYSQTGGSGDSLLFNIAIGDSALYSSNPQDASQSRRNTAIGHKSLFSNSSGHDNYATGHRALASVQEGSYNVAIGNYSLFKNLTYNNTAIGFSALCNHVSGDNNVAIGVNAMFSGTTGFQNIAIGTDALRNATGCWSNIGIGSWSNYNNSVYFNIGIGDSTLYSNSSGFANIAIGHAALKSNIQYFNIGIGYWALHANNQGTGNVALGHYAMERSTSGQVNTAVGHAALQNNVNGNANIAIGNQAMTSNTSGDDNTAVGSLALSSNTSGDWNVAAGSGSLAQNTSGFYNVGVGTNSLNKSTISNYCVAVGSAALYNQVNGVGDNDIRNTAVGNAALFSTNPTTSTNGRHNTAVGADVMFFNTTGSYNTAVGWTALWNNTVGDSNVAIGRGAVANANNLNNVVVIGTSAIATASGQVVLGNVNSKSLFCLGAYNATSDSCPNLYVSNSGQIMRSNSALSGSGTPTQLAFWRKNRELYSSPDLTWDTANNRLGIRTSTPGQALEVFGNVELPISDNSKGNIYKDTLLFIHNYLFYNTFTGIKAGNLSMAASAVNNSGFGYHALKALTYGIDNTAVGNEALTSNTYGHSNTAQGSQALISNIGGEQNSAVGYQALMTNLNGSLNTAVGYKADVLGPNLINATAVGANAKVNVSNKVRIGDLNVTVIEGQVPWSFPSDIRIKKNVSPISRGLGFVMDLKPMEYQTLTDDRTSFGFIAQDIEALLGDEYAIITVNDNEEQTLTMRITDLIAPMVRAIQEQQAIIEAQQQQLEQMQKRLETLESAKM